MAEHRRVGPRNYLIDHPTPNSVKFGGRYINLLELARGENMNHSYLSYIISGQRNPSIPYAERLADALGMGLEELLDSIKFRRAELRRKRQEAVA